MRKRRAAPASRFLRNAVRRESIFARRRAIVDELRSREERDAQLEAEGETRQMTALLKECLLLDGLRERYAASHNPMSDFYAGLLRGLKARIRELDGQ